MNKRKNTIEHERVPLPTRRAAKASKASNAIERALPELPHVPLQKDVLEEADSTGSPLSSVDEDTETKDFSAETKLTNTANVHPSLDVADDVDNGPVDNNQGVVTKAAVAVDVHVPTNPTVVVTSTPVKTVTALELAIRTGRVKSGDALNTSTSAQDSNATNLAYPPLVRVTIQLPAECEVTKPDLQSFSLRDSYKGLPPLKEGSFTARNLVEDGPGSMMYDDWYIHCPNMDILGKALPAMLFTHDKKLVNLARCDPRILKGAVNPHSSKGADARVLTFNDSSQPATPNPANRKSISGIMHSQDVERFIAVSCMVFNEDNLTAPLYNNAFSFETRPASGRSFTPPSSPSKPSSSLRSPKKTLGSQSILTKSNGANQGGYVKTSLAADEEVIIYDGRYKSIKWPSDLSVLDQRLPKFTNEIPKNSLAVVAHTMTTYPHMVDAVKNGLAD
ncbi:hypothetical protein ONZ45_g10770 [Pleurotus djamor]|nr:hypothetical protein ONZ45_g10770 [Pleurotus djamor]